MLDSLRLLLVAWLLQKSEHVLLVSLHTRLVERIDSQHISAYSTRILEELEEASDIVGTEILNRHLELRDTAINMGGILGNIGGVIFFILIVASMFLFCRKAGGSSRRG